MTSLNHSQPLTVMLLDSERSCDLIIEQALLEAGYHAILGSSLSVDLTQAVRENRADMLVIVVNSPDKALLDNIARLNKQQPLPIVMFVNTEASQAITDTIKAGVSGYVVDGLQANRIHSILQTAHARFNEMQTLKSELESVKGQLEDRKLIDKAKGLIMKHQGCDEPAAYQALRKLAMDRSQKMVDVATSVIAVMALMGDEK